MEVLQTLSVALGLAALSGVSLYLTVFSTGLAIHFGWIHLAPQFQSLSVLGDPAIIVISGILFALEFFADKIPWVDSIWDAVHTIIRPVGGAFLALRALGQTSPVFEVIVALLAGTVSFASHSLKASTRLVVNGSPEPFSNIAVSVGENIFVIAVGTLLWHYPIYVFCGLALLFALTFYFLPRIWRSIRIKVWFISRKLNQVFRADRIENLPDKLPARFDKAVRRLSETPGSVPFTVAWAVPCVSGKGKYPNRFGYLIASKEGKVCFARKTFFGSVLQMLQLEHFSVSLEHRLLYEELHLSGSGKNASFLFDRPRALLAEKVAQELEHRITPAKPLTLAESTRDQ